MQSTALTVFGTRPEAIKLAPVLHALQERANIRSLSCSTGQHREMLQQVLDVFNIRTNHNLSVMRENQSLTGLTGSILAGIDTVLAAEKPDIVVVQGDTTTAFAAALAAFYHKIPVAHVEAGLRTHNMSHPWPEEANRRLIAPLAALHFCPTAFTRDNLLNEGIPPAACHVTGNTVVDAMLQTDARLGADADFRREIAAALPAIPADKKMILVTGHRRENFGEGFAGIFKALAQLAARPDVHIVYPVHLNPNVRNDAFAQLGDRAGISLVEPLSYAQFIYAMKQAHFIITDSGGIQEEAPTFRKPVLVTRNTTERREAVDAGAARLVGTSAETILQEAERLLDDPTAYEAMTRAENPYGDGTAATRIADRIAEFLRR